MSDDLVIKDPELAEVLRKIAGDPSSGLLRIPEERITRWVTNREREVTVGEPFLTRAERYLVQEHREEVARLLYQACQNQLLKRPSWETMLHRAVGPGVRVELPTDEVWEGSAREAVKRGAQSDDDLEGLGILESCARGDHVEVSPARLAAASLRLVPRDETRIWLAIAFNVATHLRSSVAVLENVLANRPTAANESYAREDMAFLRGLQHLEASAVREYRAASMASQGRIAPALAWMHMSLVMSEESQTIDAASFLGKDTDGQTDAVEDHVSMWEHKRRAGAFTPNRESRGLARKLMDGLSWPAKRVCHVFE